MKRWSKNSYLDALYKTIVLLIIAHIIFLIVGYYWGGMWSVLGFTMLWPHMETGIWGYLSSMIYAVIIYGLVYAYAASKDKKEEQEK